MTIRIKCPNRRCKRKLKLSADWFYAIRVRCVVCHERFTVYAKTGYIAEQVNNQDVTRG